MIEAAIETWASAAGLTLQQVSGEADINIGWGDFDTASSNVVGYTAATSFGGMLQPGSVVRLEDPGETPLIDDADGDLVYSGTDITLYQSALHEIGHALGLPDDSDPNSIMYPALGPSNSGLDSADIAAIRGLYGTVGAVSALFPDAAMLAAMASAPAMSPALAGSALH